MAEKKATKAATTKKAAAPKKECVKKTATKNVALAFTAEKVGFRAGDVYQTLATAEKALTVSEIAKAAKISAEEVLLGAGWLLKEGKVTDAEGKIVLA